MKKLKITTELTGRPTHATKTDLKTGYAKKTKLFEDDTYREKQLEKRHTPLEPRRRTPRK